MYRKNFRYDFVMIPKETGQTKTRPMQNLHERSLQNRMKILLRQCKGKFEYNRCQITTKAYLLKKKGGPTGSVFSICKYLSNQ